MYRPGTRLEMYPEVNFVLAHAALGDMIGSLPAIIRARKENPAMKIVLFVQHGQRKLVKTLLAPYGSFTVENLDDLKGMAQHGQIHGPCVINSVEKNTQTRNRIPLVDFGFIALLDALPNNDAERNYPNAAPIGHKEIEGKYICMQVGFTAKNREFKHPVMKAIIEWAIVTGRKVVIVGSSKTHAGKVLENGMIGPRDVQSNYDDLPDTYKDACIDMRDKTVLTQARNILGHADAVVGIDGGLLHLAGTTDVPIVYGFTHVRPEHRQVFRHGKANWRVATVTPRDLGCAGCQSNWTLVFGHCFTTCAYEDYLCTDKLDPKDFVNALNEVAL